MRVQPRFALLLVVASAIVSAQSGQAQDTFFPQQGMQMPPAGAQFAPPGQPMPGGMPYPGGQPQSWSPIQAGQGTGLGGGPPQLAWPNISPFENGYEKYENENGLWTRLTRPVGRDYYGYAETFYAKVRKPGTELVGDQNVFDIQGSNAPGFNPVTTDVFFTTLITDLGTPGSLDFVDTIFAQEEHADHERPSEFGVNLAWGWRNPSDDGFEAGFFYVPEATYFFQRGTGRAGVDLLDLRVTAGLALNDGTTSGVVVPYDRAFRIDFDTESAGANTSWIFTPMVDKGWFKLQPMMGLRYNWIGERFGFFGADSGAAAVFDGTGVPLAFVPPLPPFGPYSSELNMNIDSHLFGPEIGMRFTIGGKYLRISGGSAFGLAANFESLNLTGRGIGDGFNAAFDERQAFNESRSHVRLSPMAAANVSLEADLFPLVPLLRKFALLEGAKFRLGYKIVGATEIQRPQKAIQWNGQPLTPVIRESDREKWFVSGWTMGIHWDF